MGTHEKAFYVYILASEENGTLYIGVTSNLANRGWQHKDKIFDASFTKKYNITNLVYYEQHASADEAFKREKQLKKWN